VLIAGRRYLDRQAVLTKSVTSEASPIHPAHAHAPALAAGPRVAAPAIQTVPPPATSPAATGAPPTAPRIDPRLIASLAAVYVIWSSTYLAMRIAVRELPPLVTAGSRYLVAGAIMLAFARRRGVAWPTARQWLRVVPVGALLFAGGNGLVSIAQQSVSSGGAAVVCATMPLWTGVLAVVSGERPSRREWLSLVVGFAGVLVLMGGPSLAGEPMHVVLIVLAPVCWALGSILARRTAAAISTDAIMAPAMQMVAGGGVLAVLALAAGEPLVTRASSDAWLALGYLIVFGSLIGFTAYSWLLRNAPPTVATSYAYVNPILAVVAGAALAGEALGVTTLIANVLIVGAIGLALARPRRRAATPALASPPPARSGWDSKVA
jgi:drug/metabolite transporter (DMT)-like permease